jgi:hypothetical protein
MRPERGLRWSAVSPASYTDRLGAASAGGIGPPNSSDGTITGRPPLSASLRVRQLGGLGSAIEPAIEDASVEWYPALRRYPDYRPAAPAFWRDER